MKEKIGKFFKKIKNKQLNNFFHRVSQRSGTMKYLSSLPDLDRELAYVDSQFKISDDHGRVALVLFVIGLRPILFLKIPVPRNIMIFK
jgi:hypothetical protein